MEVVDGHAEGFAKRHCAIAALMGEAKVLKVRIVAGPVREPVEGEEPQDVGREYVGRSILEVIEPRQVPIAGGEGSIALIIEGIACGEVLSRALGEPGRLQVPPLLPGAQVVLQHVKVLVGDDGFEFEPAVGVEAGDDEGRRAVGEAAAKAGPVPARVLPIRGGDLPPAIADVDGDAGRGKAMALVSVCHDIIDGAANHSPPAGSRILTDEHDLGRRDALLREVLRAW